MANETVLVAVSDADLRSMLDRGALRPSGYEVIVVADRQGFDAALKGVFPHLVILDEGWEDGQGIEQGRKLHERSPALPMILISAKPSPDVILRSMRSGFCDCLILPVRTADVVNAVQRALEERSKLGEVLSQDLRRHNKVLQKRLSALEALQRVGRMVTSLLDLDSILTTVVDAAVELTGAEEGSLLLLDESSGELYMRAARNFQDDFVRKFRIPFRDSLAGQVMRTGKPIIVNETIPQKIKTSYLVHTLIYAPLQVHGRVIGVLGVDNRQSGHPFLEEHTELISTLADFAAIAIENARAYNRTELERNKLETILTRVEDGVIVVDTEGRLVIANHTVRSAFNLETDHLTGKPARLVFQHPDLLTLLDAQSSHSSRTEITLEDGRVFNTMVTPIPNVGLVITMQDITHLKELDRIKSDFVHTVSHDLRSPLTAILGYIELIERVGPLTPQQLEFIKRVQVSVHNITNLIDDLLELGRIEAGFDTRKEIVPLENLIRLAVDELQNQMQERNQELILEIQENSPPVLGNPVHLKQMIVHLIGNAVKYSPTGGHIQVKLQHEARQVFFQVIDNGPGIPASDQPYVFDKFFRGSNIAFDTSGTGLGLAIVKSIVENHQGRIWLESEIGRGSTFTVVLPIADQEI